MTADATHGDRPKLFGIGLNKTGTTTLGACMARLGWRHKSADRELLLAWERGDLDSVFRVIDQHDSFEDWPYPLMWREIYQRYGDGARYVLTVRRDAETWLASLMRHSLITHPHLHARRIAYGHDYPHGREAEHLAFYERHNDAVRRFFDTPERRHLFTELCWERGDGWPALCGLLDVPVPDEPLPHANRMTDERIGANRFTPVNTEAIKRQLREIGVCEEDIARALRAG